MGFAGEAMALGGVFRNGRVTAFANGGIPDYVNSPTLAPMALFGEAGPEAIMPLRRGPDGRLGVEVNGGGNQAVVVELRAVRQEIVNLRGSVEEADNDGGGGVVEAIAELRIQIGGLREELRTNRLRAQ
jgi:phage-related minor tail protein